MKAFISKISDFLKSLFLRLRVIVTLQLGRNKVKEDGSNPGTEDPETEKGNDYEK